MYWDKNFANRTSYLPGSCGWSSQIAMCICMCVHDHANVSKFHCKKICGKKISPTACIGEISEIFLLGKVSAYTVPCVNSGVRYLRIARKLFVTGHWARIHTCSLSPSLRATPPIARGKGSGEWAYSELFCDKILSRPIRFIYSGIWHDVIRMLSN